MLINDFGFQKWEESFQLAVAVNSIAI